jgi:hypothetical protein
VPPFDLGFDQTVRLTQPTTEVYWLPVRHRFMFFHRHLSTTQVASWFTPNYQPSPVPSENGCRISQASVGNIGHVQRATVETLALKDPFRSSCRHLNACYLSDEYPQNIQTAMGECFAEHPCLQSGGSIFNSTGTLRRWLPVA